MTVRRKKSNETGSTNVPRESPGKTRQKSQEGIRETVEAVAIAFILAFVFKTFEAEAFVIPTGSMAPTLFGRHKEVTCEGCRLCYPIGASQEIDQETGILNPVRNARIEESVCPNCRYLNKVKDVPVFNGDRIVVNKQVAAYRRFDVVVFKNPEEPHVNYIKRLVGLPGETIRIRQGDIHMRRSDSEPWVIQRKEDLEKQRDIQLLVYDDRFPPRVLLDAGGEERWAPAGWSESDSTMGGWPATENSWKPDPVSRTYTAEATDDQLHWLRYRNLIAAREQWASAKNGRLQRPLEPQLIADFCGFNCDTSADHELYWCNDLTLEFSFSIKSATEKAQLLLELVEGFRTVRCQVNPISGLADIIVISRENGNVDSQQKTIASVQTGIHGPGEYTLAFANVDDRLSLWVNDDLIPLGDVASFQTTDLNLPTDLDLAPIGIAVSGMTATASDLVVRRDIYYRNDVLNYGEPPGTSADSSPSEYSWQFHGGPITVTEVESSRYARLSTSLRAPRTYAQEYAKLINEQDAAYGNALLFRLKNDEYLMFGDNSPASKDSRLFDFDSRPLRGINSSRYAVREQDLIGEALWIFWPHGIPFMNGGRGYPILSHHKYGDRGQVERDDTYPLYSVPFYPNLSRMKRIR
jgi:signal peptidase I